MNLTTPPAAAAHGKRRRLVAVGVVAAGLTVAGVGAGAAMAVAPTSAVSRAVAGTLHGAGVDWSSMPDGYTRAQYEAFWGAGYTASDVDALNVLWKSEPTETKSQAGQLILDGKPLPITPGQSDADSTSVPQAQSDAFWGAGYTIGDVEKLNALWKSETVETKTRAGQMILDGQTPPVAPSDAAHAAS